MGSKPKAPAPITAGQELRSLTRAQIEVAPDILAAQEQLGPQFAQQQLEFGARFGPQFAAQARALEEQVSPELVSVRKRLGTALAKRLETPGQLPEAQLERFRSTVRASQALRGVAESGISAFTEATQLAGVTEAAAASTRSQALQFIGLGGGVGAPRAFGGGGGGGGSIFGGGIGIPSFGVSPATAVQSASAFNARNLQQFQLQQEGRGELFSAAGAVIGAGIGPLAFPATPLLGAIGLSGIGSGVFGALGNL